MRTRNWPIRAKIVSLLLVPLIALIVMWVLATAVTLGPGLDLLATRNTNETTAKPAQALVGALQTERTLSLAYLATNRRDASALTEQRRRTDAAVRGFRGIGDAGHVPGSSTEQVDLRRDGLLTSLDGLAALRANVDRGDLDPVAALHRYNEIMDAAFLLFDANVRIADDTLFREARALVAMGRGRELLSREYALVSAALADGTFTTYNLSEAVQLIGAQRYTIGAAVADLNEADRAEYERLVATGPFGRLATLENRLLDEAEPGVRPPVSAVDWRPAWQAVDKQLEDFSLKAADGLAERSRPMALAIIGRLALAALLGLATVIITIVASIRLGRSILRRLAGLRQAAAELAVDRLPGVIARLRRGEQVDVAHEAPELPYGDDEIGQVGHAFNEVQRTAVRSAVEEAAVRRGINEVFLNIARRSQTLLHRQLSILDRMERRAEDPTELEDLFRIDHLATRMRRHAEDLVILAGSVPGRGWRNPVPVVDVLRGAVSEVEDYARVSIRPLPEVALEGRAVGDVIHLLAELIENATSFSPPHTRVNIGGELVPHGFAIEVEDRGLGMTQESLAECNQRLVDPPDFDPVNSAQLGLFVVARLAARHGVKVQLRPSAYGGITAVALIPDDLVITAGEFRRELLAALPPGETNGSAREALYRELSAPRPAIAASEAPVSPEVVAPPAPRAARHARREIIDATESPDGLPRRIRQRSLAPQLRDEPTDDESATPGAASRSPDEMRAMMSSFQAATNRARQETDDGVEPEAGR
jgi:signal transduction histidine kinase